MPTTEQQRRAIAFITRTYRAGIHGANAWDEAGIMSALNRVRGIECGMVTVAAMRAAADASLKTPAKIGDTNSTLYAEQVGPPTARRHPRPEEACRTCGRDYGPDCCDRPAARPDPTEDYPGHAAQARAALREAEKSRPAPEERPVVRDSRADDARTELKGHVARTPQETEESA